jgi:hypothetical protein
MPLLPKTPETCPVVVDNEDGTQDTYEIRKWVNPRQYAETSADIAEAALLFAQGNGAREAAVIRESVLGMMTVQQRMVAAWLVRWSHEADITPANIERMPLPHLVAVVTAIRERNEAQAGVRDTDPLAATSANSSAGATPDATPTSTTNP